MASFLAFGLSLLTFFVYLTKLDGFICSIFRLQLLLQSRPFCWAAIAISAGWCPE